MLLVIFVLGSHLEETLVVDAAEEVDGVAQHGGLGLGVGLGLGLGLGSARRPRVGVGVRVRVSTAA